MTMTKSSKTQQKKERIFVSFLGTSDYKVCRYHFDNEPASGEIKFVQTVTAEKSACEQVVIFCTKKAEETHWKDLEAEFCTSNLPKPIRIRVCDGASEEELWSIFDAIQKEIPENATVTFDVTHSFRFLPLLMTVLLNYLKEVKKVELEKCYYGAWEARDERNIAPVFDLTPFFVLNDWARATSFFDEAGDCAQLYGLVKKTKGNLWKKKDAQSDQKFADNLTKSVQKVDGLISAIRTCRGKTIKEADKSEIFSEAEVEMLKKHFPAFVPIYEQLKSSFPDYAKNDERNGLLAAKWCADHGMIQQGYTILQETMKALVFERWKEVPEKQGILARIERNKKYTLELINACLSCDKIEKWNNPELTRDNVETLRNGDYEIVKLHKSLTNLRNDINHAGLLENSPDPGKLKALLSKFVEGAIEIFGLPTKKVLIGNSFPFPLIRRPVDVRPMRFEAFPKDAEICSFWGHTNTLAVASEFLGVDLTPKTDRPALTLSENQLPVFNGEEFSECWIVSPNYAEAFRTPIGEETLAEKIKSWMLLKICWR